jgi:hypothetical protein
VEIASSADKIRTMLFNAEVRLLNIIFRNTYPYDIADSMGTTHNKDSEEISEETESYSGVASSVQNCN